MAALWHVGDRIQQRWEVHQVRRGGLGLVYIVYDHEAQLSYAMKTVPEALSTSSHLVERWQKAARMWIELPTHAQVVKAHTIETIDGQPLLVLDHVSGGDLRDWIGLPRLTQDLPQIVRFAMQLCDAMVHLQQHGIRVHRDLKPGNCLITADGALQLTDLGLAPVFDGLELPPGEVPARALTRLLVGPRRTGTIAGTCTHMAPELFDASPGDDVRGDVYAFGILLYQMVTGTVPFQGQTWQEMAHLHATEPVPAWPESAAVLRELLERCLAKDPAQRPDNFDAVRAQLLTVYAQLSQTPAPTLPTGTALEVVRWNIAGTGLESLGQYQAALACYDHALAIDSRSEVSWLHRGTALESLGRGTDALACCDHALQLNPQSDHALVTKGMMLGAAGQMEEARTYCDRALKMNPRNEQAWVNMGAALDAMGRQMEALGCYNNVLTLNPRNVQAWFNAGVVLGEMGRHEEALGCCERVLALDPRNDQAWVNKGLTLGELQRADEALTCFDRALELTPSFGQAWFNKGVALFNTFQRYDEALTCFIEAERLGYEQAAEGVALCKEELGQA